jgi:putative DNA primase/helicase
MQELLYWIKTYYNPGSRNDIIFYLSGMFRLGGFTQETARTFIIELCTNSGYADEDLPKSLDVCDNTYDKPLEQVAGKSGLHQVLVTSHADTDDTDEYLERGEAYARVCQILNPPSNPSPPPSPPPADSGGRAASLQPQQGETDTETKVRGLTETLERRYHFAAMDDTDELFYYNEEKGLYESARALVKTQVEKQYPGVVTSTVTNVIEKLARRHLHKRDEFDADLYIINMANGLYDIRTNTLKPHTWEYLSRKRTPIKFDPNIRPKRWGKFLYEVLYPNQIRTAVEAMAYTFLRDNPFEIYYILLGFGSNGKSVLMHVLTKLHGEDNVSNVSLTTLLKERFARRGLEGMNVNIDMEMSRATIDDMSVLKELTGSQPIRVEPKYKDAYNTRLWAKMFFSTNEMPDMQDHTDAHYRREVIISFPNQFIEGENANPNLKHELTTEEELSGIFNALMIPLRRIAMEHVAPYMDAKTIQERKIKHQLTTDPVKAFLESATEPKDYESDYDVTKEELYEGYKKFCAFYKIPWERYDPFCKLVKGKGYKESRETGGDRKRIWVGIRLKKYMFEDTLTV